MHRPVAPFGSPQDVHDQECFEFEGDEDGRSILRTRFLSAMLRPGEARSEAVTSEDEQAFLVTLEELARSYLTWKTLPHQNRTEARAHLLRIADLAKRRADLDDVELDILVKLVVNPNDSARAALWAQLIESNILPASLTYLELTSGRTDWSIYAAAAKAAIVRFNGGDYANMAMAAVISSLVNLTEWYTGKPATLNGRHKDPSPIYRFAKAFFEKVDPAMQPSTIYNKLEEAWRARRRRKACPGK